MSDIVERAEQFARQAHAEIDQRRKFTGEPYIVHPQEVARIVATVTTDTATIAAAWLHDVVEDTPVTLQQVVDAFGEEIASLVENLTDISQLSDGNRERRLQIDRDHTALAEPRAKTVKLADIIHNLSDISRAKSGFARRYILEKQALLRVLSDGDPVLYRKAQDTVARLAREYGCKS